MAAKTTKTKNQTPPSNPTGMFVGMIVFLVETGVQNRRLQIWKKKLEQMGATVEESLTKRVTYILAMNSDALRQRIDADRLARFKGRILLYQWLEDSLRSGEKVSEDIYDLKLESLEENKTDQSEPGGRNDCVSNDDEPPDSKKLKVSGDMQITHHAPEASKDAVGASVYNPPDLNKNITDIFRKLIDIYRALGDDRRSFSYYKAIAVVEKLPFKIESAQQVKELPSIGKSMQDHIQEIVTTGKLSKLDHFETDEKVLEKALHKNVFAFSV